MMFLEVSTGGTVAITVFAFLTVILLLVALLLFVKQKLAPSGPVKITINGEKTIEVPSGGTLLSTLLPLKTLKEKLKQKELVLM